MALSRDELLLKLGGAKSQYPAAWRLVRIRIPEESEPVNERTFGFPVTHVGACQSSSQHLPLNSVSDFG